MGRTSALPHILLDEVASGATAVRFMCLVQIAEEGFEVTCSCFNQPRIWFSHRVEVSARYSISKVAIAGNRLVFGSSLIWAFVLLGPLVTHWKVHLVWTGGSTQC